jgi:hypothetical protein
MGAVGFYTKAVGSNPQQAFVDAVKAAAFENGHGGYTGTIAEKSKYRMFNVPARRLPALEHEPNYKWQSDAMMRVVNALEWYLDARDRGVDPDTFKMRLGFDVWSVDVFGWDQQVKADARFIYDIMGRVEFEQMVAAYNDKWGLAVGFDLDDNEYAFIGTASC